MRKIPSQAEYRYLLREFQTQMRFKHSCILEILGHSEATEVGTRAEVNPGVPGAGDGIGRTESGRPCLLYTSDAADELEV